MPAVRYNLLHTLIQRMAATRPGAWIVADSLQTADDWVLRLSRGRHTLSGLLAGIPVVTVITTGARSGRPHPVPLLPVRDPLAPQHFALIATSFGRHHLPAWYYNLRAHPRAECIVDAVRAAHTAREAAGEEYDRYWQRAVEIYPGYAAYALRAGRRIPIMIMEPDESAGMRQRLSFRSG